MENFTPISSLAGGILIGIAATLMLAVYGRITGISGILGGLLFPVSGEILWRALFIAGLVAGPALYLLVIGGPIEWTPQASPLTMVVAGLLVGYGTRMGSGCTSGHGICGIARVSKRSFAATAVFMGVAIITVFVLRHLLGVSL
ncbi:MAG: hypothetical protein RLZZ385_1594 [Pseudomonadota bacterium]|jgi:uncharacterized membrane protein YedE/YeeE